MALGSVPELIAMINQLPPGQRARARRRVEQAIDRPAVEARAALGVLAAELTAADADGADHFLGLEPAGVLHHATA